MASKTPPLDLPSSLSPDDLDALSELSIVLAKVRSGLQSSQGLSTGATPSGPGGSSSSGQQLSFKDVPGATDKLKHKLQHARAQVRALPDMDRTLDEQRSEIKELETRIDMQRKILEQLRDGGVAFSKTSSATGDKMEM